LKLELAHRFNICLLLILGYVFLLSFFLDKKERKNQDVAKLPPHLAERWPAATSAHRAGQNGISIISGVLFHALALFAEICHEVGSFEFPKTYKRRFKL